MKYQKLLELEQEGLLNPHYQHKDLTQDQRIELANKSFLRLTLQDRELVTSNWLKYCKTNKIEFANDGDAVKKVIWLRFLSQSNLFFLCRLLEKYKDVTEKTHEDICNEFFVSKDPANYKTFEEFAKAYLDLKQRLLLVPRGGFKSSIDIADCVQWITCYPEVTILILTGVYDLAKDFLGELRSHFTYSETGEIKDDKAVFGPKATTDGTPSLFQVMFPEHCIKPGGAATEFQTPACKLRDKEPTVMAASIEQNLSGWHFCLLKLDDVVTNENSLTIGRMAAINKQISVNNAMLHPFGFFDVIGTWYDECLVGNTLVTMADWKQKEIKDIKVGDEVVGFTNEFGKRSMLVKSKVTNVFVPSKRKVYKYTFQSGRYVVSTDSHLWWKGANGSESTEYSKIGFEYRNQKFVRRLLVPRFEDTSKCAGYLAGLYDGEGSFQGNPGQPSGTVTICQTQHNPEIVESMRNTLSELGYEVTEYVSQAEHNDKHEFKLLGGWQTRYKFLTEINPKRRHVIEHSLFGQNITEKDYLVSVEDAGEELTYCFETETHNYIADGCCSHNCDYYGITIKSEEKIASEDSLQHMVKGSVFEGVFNSKVTFNIYLRSAWWPTLESKKLGKIEDEMVEKDWVLWFPERLSYKFLHLKKRTDSEGFAIKYENNPRKVHQVKFPRELLLRKTIPGSNIPSTGLIVTTWDTAYSLNNLADYTVGITALIYGGRFYVIDMVRGKFNDVELPKIIATTGYKWKPKRIAIEDSMGVRWISREIRREMDKLQISIPVEYVPLGQGSKARSKEIKAKPVLRLLGDDRLFFLNSCAGLEELYAELEKFPNGTHDDIVSGLSILVEQFAAYADMDARMNSVKVEYNSDQKSKDMHDRIYCLGRYANLTDENMADIPSYAEVKQPVEPFSGDPLQELFS